MISHRFRKVPGAERCSVMFALFVIKWLLGSGDLNPKQIDSRIHTLWQLSLVVGQEGSAVSSVKAGVGASSQRELWS